MKKIIIIAGIVLGINACKSIDDEERIALSYTPQGKVTVQVQGNQAQGSLITIDFGYDDYVAGYIESEISQDEINSIRTRSELINYYESATPYFQPGYSSMSNNNEYLFTKLEYQLARECFQDNCTSQDRQRILEMVIDKQEHKFVEFASSFCTRRTGAFLIAVILLKEGNQAFIESLNNNSLISSALQLNIEMPIDQELSEQLKAFTER